MYIADLNKTEELLTTQFIIQNKLCSLQLGFFVEQLYAPDFPVADVKIALNDLLKEIGFQRSPVLRQIPLRNEINGGDTPSYVIINFFVQLFAE